MASPQAHYKLKRLLKAWVITNPGLVYWQGLDSLSAPFLYLNFNNEAVAYGCLVNFVNKYSTRFFLKDNSFVIHEYLAVFSHLIAFHDAELASHFESIEFKPDLYAIPWFLTMFAHVFPLSKIFHLWDTLLLGNNSFPLCVGAAILKQLRNLLLDSDFNECIFLFSEVPEINIAKCATEATNIYNTTPPSCLYRQHSYGLDVKTPFVQDTDLDMSPVSIDKLRNQLCPRISGRDLLALFEDKETKISLIDLRAQNEYQMCCIPNSYNVPFDNVNFPKLKQIVASQVQLASNTNENDSTAYLVYLLQQNKSFIKIVLTSETRFKDSIELANQLVMLQFNKICVLNKGIECLKASKILLQEIL